jgi:predicted transcriptional regulator
MTFKDILEILKLALEIWSASKKSPNLPQDLRESLQNLRNSKTQEERQNAVTRITERINKL